MRRRVTAETEREFAPFPALWEAAITEFVATVGRFSADGVIGELDCSYVLCQRGGRAGSVRRLAGEDFAVMIAQRWG